MNDPNPRIIARSDHPVSRRLISPNAVKLLYRLRDNGFTAYLVGGCVRDLWLGREPKDFDVATDATPSQMKRLFRNCRLVGRRFRLAHLHFKDEIIEVATFRSQQPEEPEEVPSEGEEPAAERQPRMVKDDDGMILRDNVFGTPAEDALRRDFTVNALFYNIADFTVIDYAEGIDDLMKGIIRPIGDPQVRFTEDPVRMIRAVRFAALLGFTIEEDAWRAIRELAGLIDRAAPPRLYEEILKLFLSGEGEQCFQLMRRSGLFAPLFPGFDAWLDTESEGFPHVRVGNALEEVDSRLAAGKKVSPPLLFALLFGERLEEGGAEFRTKGAPPQQALFTAVDDFFADLSPTVSVPNRVVLGVREILASRLRFRKTPGKNAAGFMARPSFPDSLEYLRFLARDDRESAKLLAWWENFSAGKEEAAPAEAPAAKKPRRRRRRRKKAAAPAE
jgi:poly(A) polymerase